MSSTTDLLNSIQASQSGLTLAELLAGHPDIARRTAQRLIAKLIESGQVKALGEGRARRYFSVGAPSGTTTLVARVDIFPSFIPLSADSQDILAYIDQPPAVRGTVRRRLRYSRSASEAKSSQPKRWLEQCDAGSNPARTNNQLLLDKVRNISYNFCSTGEAGRLPLSLSVRATFPREEGFRASGPPFRKIGVALGGVANY